MKQRLDYRKRGTGSSSRRLPIFIDRLADDELEWYERNKNAPAAATCALDIDSIRLYRPEWANRIEQNLNRGGLLE
ncbi:hypothetical protein LINGRAHAP2_LOCUS10718, partial [Linum grandiflorum]